MTECLQSPRRSSVPTIQRAKENAHFLGRPLDMLNHPEERTYDPVNCCIYCGSDEQDSLRREHILPYGLNGKLVLPKASCGDCAKITSAIESFCLQRMFIDARTHLSLPTRSWRRNRKPRPPLRIGHVGKDGEVERWQELSSGAHPFAIATADFSPAGIFLGRSRDAEPKIELCLIPSPSFAARFSKLPPNSSINFQVDTDMLARMLAKIAHSFAVASYGFGGFHSFLPDVILGRSKDIFHFVGGAAVDPQRNPNALHNLQIRRDNPGLITTYVRLFSFIGAPAYRIAVGRTL